jgi:PAS domain S-box-containing protein/putative nucleotidyltransferase with HDIG domain
MEQFVELDLKDSELRYRRLFEAAQDGILILNAKNGAITDVNPFLIDLLGYSRDEFIGKRLWEVGAFKDIEASQDAFEALQNNEYIRYDDLPLKANDGRLIQVEFVSNVYTVDGKKVIQCNIRDITTRKRAEKAKIESEDRYQSLLGNMLEGCLIIGPDWRYLYVNDAAVKHSKLKKEQLIGHTIMECYPGIEKTDVFALLQKCVQEHKSFMKLNEFTFPDHSKGWFELSIQPTAFGVFILSNDITEKKQSEESLKIAFSQLKNLNDNLPEAIFSVDVVQNIMLKVSPGHEAVFGYPCDAFYQNPDLWKEIIVPEDRLSVEASVLTLSNGKILHIQYRIIRPEGEIHWIESIIKPVLDEKGLLIRADGIASDITKRKLSEEKIQRQLEHLTALSKIDRVIAANFNLEFCLSQILSQVTVELGVDVADVLVLNPNSQILEFGAEIGFKSKAIRKAKIKLGESYAGLVALDRQLIHVTNLQQESKTQLLSSLSNEENFVCYYGVPLIAKGKVNGVLEIFHRTILETDDEWLDFLKSLAGQTAIAIDNGLLFENQQRSNQELNLAYNATIEGWSAALDLRDEETEGHTERVTEKTVKLARIIGLSEDDLVQVRWGSLLHDIGKMRVPEAILHKPGPLTPDEWVIMKKHPTYAFEMLSPIRYLRLALDIPYCHHEKWDGSGYPQGLKGDQIPFVARIFAVEDVWDALTSDRPYRKAWTKEEAKEYINTASGIHFDPQVVNTFMNNINLSE